MPSTDDFLPEARLLLKKPFTEISLDEKNQVIIARWKGILSLEDVQEGCRFMTAIIREHKLQRHLSDHRELRVLSPAVQQYLSGEWFFEVEQEGLRKIGARLAKDIFAQATVRRVNTLELYGKLEIQNFTTCEAVYDWLLAE